MTIQTIDSKTAWRNILTCIVFLILCQPVKAKVWILSDSNLNVRFDDQTTMLSVTDKRCNGGLSMAWMGELKMIF